MIILLLAFGCGCACGCWLRPGVGRRLRRWFHTMGPDLRIHITSSGAPGLRYHVDPNARGFLKRRARLMPYFGCGNCTEYLEFHGPE
eukprot:9898513-Alexandrium_andersonii.AAC.1